MEVKWIAICVIAFAAAMMAPVTISEYTRSQCKVSYSQSDKTADEIIKICGK